MASGLIGHDLTCRRQPNEDLVSTYPWQSVPPRAAVTSNPPPRPTDGEQVFPPDSSTASSHFAPESGCTPEPQLVIDRDRAFR